MNQTVIAAAILGASVIGAAYLLKPIAAGPPPATKAARYEIVGTPTAGYPAAYILDRETGFVRMCAAAKCIDLGAANSN